MAFLKVHHVTHRVHDVKQMRAYLEKNFGMLPTLEGRSETQTRFDYIAYKVGETLMDFISPVGDSGLARELKENGPGISHVAYAVDGIENLFDEMRDKGSKIKGMPLSKVRRATYASTSIPRTLAASTSSWPRENPLGPGTTTRRPMKRWNAPEIEATRTNEPLRRCSNGKA